MPDTPTPGEICYEAYYAHMTPTFAPPLIVNLWLTLSPGTRDAWEAAAQAVLEAWQAQPRLETRRWTPQPLHTEEDHA